MIGTATQFKPKRYSPANTIAPFVALPWQVAPWQDKAPILLLAGPAGTGKSHLAANKIHGYLLKYPGATGLVMRKTRQSMVNSTVLFMERAVIGHDPRVSHKQDKSRFEYSNGSILAYGGMADDEQREQIKGIGQSGGVDIIWYEEANKFTEDDYQMGSSRLRGHAAPWMQQILTTNPGPPSHWINQRLIMGGEASVYDKVRPEDNPYNPPAYIETLKRLTGILRQRLWEGKWVQAEGLVYSEFDLDNLTDDDPDTSLPYEIAWDDGYVDPRVCLLIQRTPTQILVFDELYHTRHLAERCVKEMLELALTWSGKAQPAGWDGYGLEQAGAWARNNGVWMPEIAMIPPEAKELQGRLRMADISARKADNEILPGIDVMRSLVLDGNGYRTLKINRRCKGLIREATEGYTYPEGVRRDNEKPVDANNHGPDALRYWAKSRAR